MDNILTILHENPRLSNAQIAAMTNLSEDEVGERIAFYEKSGIICGYKTVINWDKTNEEHVDAIIGVSAKPERGKGYGRQGLLPCSQQPDHTAAGNFRIKAPVRFRLHVSDGRAFSPGQMLPRQQVAVMLGN